MRTAFSQPVLVRTGRTRPDELSLPLPELGVASNLASVACKYTQDDIRRAAKALLG